MKYPHDFPLIIPLYPHYIPIISSLYPQKNVGLLMLVKQCEKSHMLTPQIGLWGRWIFPVRYVRVPKAKYGGFHGHGGTPKMDTNG